MAKAKSKKIAIEDALVPVEEQPYEVPENWCWVKIGTISDVYTGNSINERVKKEKYEGKTDGPLFIATKDVDFDNTINYETNIRITDSENFKKAPAYTSLLCIEGGSAGKKIGFTNQEVCFGNKLCAFATTNAESKYIFYYLLSNAFVYQFNEKKHGLIGGVSVRDLQKIAIPLPPIPEQQRIVEQIESLFSKLDEAKEKAQSFLDDADSRKSALINKAFTGDLTEKWRKKNGSIDSETLSDVDKKVALIKKKKIKKVQNDFGDYIRGKIPESWEITELDRISKQITDGEHQTPRRVDEFCGYYLLSARNVRNDELSLDDVDYIDDAEYTRISKRCNPQKGDVLISCSGSVGRICIVEDDNKYCMVRSSAMVSLAGGIPRYIMYMLQSGFVQEQIKKLTKQTAQANLFLGAIAALIVPFPDIGEQQQIADILDNQICSLNKSVELAEKTIADIDMMKKAILAKAFRGELGTNDPSEESSIELLKQIIANE